MNKKTAIGIIGCGNISTAYLKATRLFDNIQIVACADIDMERARKQAELYGVPRACTVEELLAYPEVEIVANLTVPNAHAEIALQAMAAGKAVYGEKPFATTRVDGQSMLAAAAERGVHIGNAPDTFLGGGFQTCIKLINDGQIGTPVAATAFVMSHGMEWWHPDPFFFYQPGVGPMFDMGPYYLTAFIAMLGPVRRVTASTQTTFPERIVTSEQNYGTKIPANTPTHIAGIMEFASGAVGTILTSFDVWHHRLPFIEIYGTEGTLSTPNPNRFDGPVHIRQAKDETWREIPLTHGYTDNARGLGIADMAYAMRSGRQHRANGEMAFHVLDIIESFMQSSTEGRHMTLASTCTRPEPLPPGEHPWDEDQTK